MPQPANMDLPSTSSETRPVRVSVEYMLSRFSLTWLVILFEYSKSSRDTPPRLRTNTPPPIKPTGYPPPRPSAFHTGTGPRTQFLPPKSSTQRDSLCCRSLVPSPTQKTNTQELSPQHQSLCPSKTSRPSVRRPGGERCRTAGNRRRCRVVSVATDSDARRSAGIAIRICSADSASLPWWPPRFS